MKTGGILVLIILELLSCLITMTISFVYEGKGLLRLGKENYKIRLGKFEQYDEKMKCNFFPIMYSKINKLRLYIDYFIFLIPGFNIIYSLLEGNKKYNNIIDELLSKDIIVLMNDEENQEYSNLKSIFEKINFTLFNSMDSYSKPSVNLINTINESFLCEKGESYNQIANDLNEYYKIKEESYEKDVSYLTSIFEFEEDKEEVKVKKIYRR